MNRLDNAEQRTPRKGSATMDEEAAAALRATVTKSGRKIKRPPHLASPDRTLSEGGRASPAKPVGRKSTKASVSDDPEKAASGSTPHKQSVSSDDHQTVKEKSSSRKTLTRKTLTSGNAEVATPKKGHEMPPNAEESGVSKSGRKLKVPAKLTDYESSLVGSPRKGGAAAAAATIGVTDAAKTPARAVRSAKKLALEPSANKAVVEQVMGRKTNISDAATAAAAAETTPTKPRGRRARSVAPIKPVADESVEDRLLKATRTPGRRFMGISMIDIGSTLEPQQNKQREKVTEAVETKENEDVEPVSKANLAKKPGRKTTVRGTLVSDVLSKPSESHEGSNDRGENKVLTTEQATQSGTRAGAQEPEQKTAQKERTETESPKADVQLSSMQIPTIVISEPVSAACSPVPSVSPEGSQGFSRSGRKIKPKKIFGTEDGDGDKSIIISTARPNDTPANSFVTRRTIDDHHHNASRAKKVPSVEPIDEPDRAVPSAGASSSAVDEPIDVPPPPASSRSGRVIKPKKFFDDGSITEKKKSLGMTPSRRQAEEEHSEAVVKMAANQSPIVSKKSIIIIPETPVPGGEVVNENVPSPEGIDVAEGPSVVEDSSSNMQLDAVTDCRKSSSESLNKGPIPSEILQEGNEINDAILPSSEPQSPSLAADDPVEERVQYGPAEANEDIVHNENVKPIDDSESTHLDDTKPIEKQSPVATIAEPLEMSIIIIPDTPAPDAKQGRQLSDTFSPEKPTLPNERLPHIAPAITISEASTTATDSSTVATPHTPGSKTGQANDCSPDKPPEVIEVLDSPASMAFCQQMKSGSSTSSTPLMNPGESQPTLNRKRSMSTSAAEAKKRNVTFHSPANVTVLVDTIDELMQKKVVRRKRSLSEHAAGAATVGADDGVKPSKISKIPNFKSIHEKNFKRMESIGDFMKRKEKRAQLILTSASPATKLLAQGVSAATTTAATTAPTNTKHNQTAIEKKPERLFTFKSGGGGGGSGGTSATATSMLNKGDTANEPTVAMSLFKRGPIARGGQASSLKRPIGNHEQRLANRQRLYKTAAPLASATTGVATASTSVAASAHSTTSAPATIRPVDQLRTKQSTILKGVRTNRRFELQMKHRDNLQ